MLNPTNTYRIVREIDPYLLENFIRRYKTTLLEIIDYIEKIWRVWKIEE